VDEGEDAQDRARRSYAAHDWSAAADAFGALAPDRLTADDLAEYADAVWWLGRVEDNLRLNVAACDAFVSDSRPAEAAGIAFRLGVFHMARGDQPQGMGWLSRSNRLLEGVPECRVHGLLLSLTGLDANLLAGQPAVALEVARQVRDLGSRLNDPGLVAVGVNGEGRALTMSGKVADGLALLDEAMVMVLEGRLDPFMTGVVYCHTIAACREVGDVRRMTRWTDLAEEWLTTVPAEAVFGAMCAVHRVQLRLLRGEWDRAELEAQRLTARLDANRVDYAAHAWYVIGEARRLRGQPSAAEAYAEAHARGLDPQPGRALLQLTDGDPEGALVSVRSAVAAAGTDPLRRAPLLAALVEIAIAAAQLPDAVAAASELEQTASIYPTSGLKATEATARGVVFLAEGALEEALPVLRDACRRWYELGSDYEAAGACVRLAEAYRALGDTAAAAAELARGEAIFERLGARRAQGELPDGLSPREYEVLTLVADGRSNREIGAALFISDRTVARHLTNIYNKIGVTSRTQAARYANDHQVSARR
jgi:DNA-binding NarL/FixJ family response regulator